MTVRYIFIASLFFVGMSFNAVAQEATILTLNRDHLGDDCVLGPVTIDHDELAWAVERPWKGQKPIWGRVLPGAYPAKATYRKGIGIELVFSYLPDHPLSALTLGAHTGNGPGRLSVGQDMVGNCRINSRKGYPIVAERLAKRLFGTPQPADRQSTNLQIRVLNR